MQFSKILKTTNYTVICSFLITFILISLSFLKPINAQNSLCNFLPFVNITFLGFSTCGGAADAEAAASVGTSIGQYIRFGLSLVFIGVAAVAIYKIVQASIKYIGSEGDEAKVEESQKSIKSVFLGFGMLFGAVIGIIALFYVFGAVNSLTVTDLPDNAFIRNLVAALQG